MNWTEFQCTFQGLHPLCKMSSRYRLNLFWFPKMDVKYIILMQKYTQPCQRCIKVLYACTCFQAYKHFDQIWWGFYRKWIDQGEIKLQKQDNVLKTDRNHNKVLYKKITKSPLRDVSIFKITDILFWRALYYVYYIFAEGTYTGIFLKILSL